MSTKVRAPICFRRLGFSLKQEKDDLMTTNRRELIFGGAAMLLTSCAKPSHVPQGGGALTADEARTIAQDAWIFGMPLVYIAVQIDTNSHVTKVEGIHAPINQFVHYRNLPDATNRSAVGLNVDTLYSFASLDLSQEGPLVLSIPKMGKRYWVMQMIDAWNNVPYAPGSRTVDGKGGDFAIVGPDWKGTLPEGMTELRIPTSLVIIGGRTYVANKQDYAAVHALQDQYKLVPLSSWGKPYTPPASVPLKPGVDTTTTVPKQVMAMSPEMFFNRLNALLGKNPPEPADPATMERIAKLGITPGGTFSMSSYSPEMQKAIEEGVANAQKMIPEVKRGKNVNGWDITLDMGRYGKNYPYRASWTFYGVGGNLAEDAIYPFAEKDGEGRPLDGANKYTLTFSKDGLPPVDAFWSLTMYDADSFLVPNPINRYALGDRSGMKTGKDGSLTIYIQHDAPPSADEKANWLPAPAGPFRLALRLYAPKKEAADGTWTPPPIKRV
jgi:hypothetical protein